MRNWMKSGGKISGAIIYNIVETMLDERREKRM
jgi:hypothetical protein